MKGFLVFLTVALVASASAASFHDVEDKNIIDDALNTIKCLQETVAGVQASINNIVGTVGNLNNVVTGNINKLNACLAIGGDKPSIIDQLASAQCVVALGGSFKAEINAIVAQMNADVNNLVQTGDNLSKCF